MKTTYTVSWKTTWSRDEATFAKLEEALEYARMKRSMNEKEVKVEKVVSTEIEF